MNRPQLIFGLLGTILGGLLLFVIIPLQHSPPLMSTVSPDFYPNIGAVILLVGGIGMLVTSFLGKSVGIDRQGTLDAIRFSCVMTGLFGITLIAFALFHFLVGGAFLVFSTMWLLGERRLLPIALTTLLSPVVIWLFIDVFLGRSLP